MVEGGYCHKAAVLEVPLTPSAWWVGGHRARGERSSQGFGRRGAGVFSGWFLCLAFFPLSLEKSEAILSLAVGAFSVGSVPLLWTFSGPCARKLGEMGAGLWRLACMVSGPCDLNRSLVPGVSPLGRFSNLCCGILGYVAWFFFFPLASHVLLLLFGTCPQLCLVVSCGAFVSAVPGNCQELFLALRVSFSYCAPFIGPEWRISHLPEVTCVFPSPCVSTFPSGGFPWVSADRVCPFMTGTGHWPAWWRRCVWEPRVSELGTCRPSGSALFWWLLGPVFTFLGVRPVPVLQEVTGEGRWCPLVWLWHP